MKKFLLICTASVIFTFTGFCLKCSPVLADPLINVTPNSYDFGEIVVGNSATASFIITNNNGHTLIVYGIDIAGNPEFTFSNKPNLPLNIPTMGNYDINVIFTPTSTSNFSASLNISSNDTVNPLIMVPLRGKGDSQTPPPSIADILAFFDSSSSEGSLIGSGSGNSAEGRMKALRNMITTAGNLIETGRLNEARQQLQDAYLRIDGQPIPPDFVAGPAADDLATMLLNLINSL